jgi:predicted molibdopterin-dependent oxidoreductase YjgC
MIKKDDSWREVTWEEALSYIAAMINKVILASGPEAVGGLISPRATNEEAFLFQRFMREKVGTPNVDSTGQLSLEPFRLAIQEVLGRDYLPYTLDDIAQSDCIVVAGGDLDENNHIIAANRIREALWRQGARLVVLHPGKGRLTEEADCWFALAPGAEAPWAQAMTSLLLQQKEAGALTVDKIKGFKELKEAVKGCTPEAVAKEIGVSPDLLAEAALYLARAKRPAFVCSPPLGQVLNGVDQIKAMVNLALICGALPDGGGFHFVGPQSNMVGVAEMGAASALLPGYAPTNKKGLSALEQLEAAAQSRLKALFVVGENPLITLPRAVAGPGIKALEFLVVQDMFLSETAEQAHVFLPALSFAESMGTFTNCEGRVQRLRRAVEPPSGLPWMGEVLAEVAAFMDKEMPIPSPAEVFAEIARNNPLYKGMAFDTVQAQYRLGSKGDLLRQAAFGAVRAEPVKGKKGYPFSLSIEGIFESHLIGSRNQKRAEGLARVSHTFLEMNAEEARRIGVAGGDCVRISTPWGETIVAIRCSEAMRRDCLVLFLSFYDVDAAQLVGPAMDPQSHVPAYEGIPARVEKA